MKAYLFTSVTTNISYSASNAPTAGQLGITVTGSPGTYTYVPANWIVTITPPGTNGGVGPSVVRLSRLAINARIGASSANTTHVFAVNVLRTNADNTTTLLFQQPLFLNVTQVNGTTGSFNTTTGTMALNTTMISTVPLFKEVIWPGTSGPTAGGKNMIVQVVHVQSPSTINTQAIDGILECSYHYE